MVEEGESNEDVARRESEEEAGIKVDKLIPLQVFQPSSGGSSEVLYTYLAICDLSEYKEGSYGLAEEQEDIRTHLVDAQDAIALMDEGTITNGAAVVALSKFARLYEWGEV